MINYRAASGDKVGIMTTLGFPWSSQACTLLTAIWRCRNSFSQWQRSFQWKLRCYWLKSSDNRPNGLYHSDLALASVAANRCAWYSKESCAFNGTKRLWHHHIAELIQALQPHRHSRTAPVIHADPVLVNVCRDLPVWASLRTTFRPGFWPVFFTDNRRHFFRITATSYLRNIAFDSPGQLISLNWDLFSWLWLANRRWL